jgi:UMF1 family MFS transporter
MNLQLIVGIVLMVVGVILFIQIIAFPFALLYGRLAERFTARRMLLAGIGVYSVITLVAFAIPSIEQHLYKVILFWLVAFMVGSSMGGIQALSRSYFGKLIPPECSGEFFGFYNVVGKFAAVLGPFLIGAIGTWTGHSRWGVLSMLVLFAAGACLLVKADEHSKSLQPPVT